VASRSWSRADDVRAAILALCAHEFVTLGELASKLGRKRVTLQQNYVSRMLEEGLLEARYPEKPSHPSQAYRARLRPERADT
jgi:ATP-dependent DNA helicase RecG